MRLLFIPILLLTLSGCGIQSTPYQPVNMGSPLPIPEADVTPPETASNNSNQNVVNGMIATSISKLAEQVVGLKANLNNLIELNTRINTRVDKLVELNAKITASVDADTTAMLGLRNELDIRFEHITATAGRDVNMLPQAAVDLMMTQVYVIAGIISTVCALASTIVGLCLRNSRKRADIRARELMELVKILRSRSANS